MKLTIIQYLLLILLFLITNIIGVYYPRQAITTLILIITLCFLIQRRKIYES